MKAMILAAGFGTRLFPLTADRTKPALPFLGKPLIGYVAEYLSQFGFKDIVVNLHHEPESVVAALGNGSDYNVKIHYVYEQPNILGTAGALDNARELLENETFLVINGKIVTDIDLRAALETHRKSNALATMILKENPKREKFTIIETESSMVKGFGGFPVQNSEPEKYLNFEDDTLNFEPPLMFTGIQILEPRVFDFIPKNQESDIISVFYRPAIAAGETIAAHVAAGNWYELSTIPRYLDVSLAVNGGAHNNIIVGRNCQIGENADVRDSILWNNVLIESGATVFRAILGDGVQIKSGEKIENAAIVRADLVRNKEIPEKALSGRFENDKYIVPLV